MSFIRSLGFILTTLLFLSHLVLSQNSTPGPGPGPCHPYPGADPQDCLALISQNLDNDTEIPCVNNHATITLGACSIVTTCDSSSGKPDSPEDIVIPYDAVRRALATIGSCALKEYGSISGYYVTEREEKTCYLYPGWWVHDYG
ncbi:hypothetical protein CVT25_001819 [Psilocybe cyanescens]|uniref:Uncharacterized protein n=1 Tax=Psilocybe cyanescens TaxID=93625 RepID=A0A409WQA9_PSICY|nr:hypothetical protein CVT25_001819 [Psilocybe cyanescens]